VLDLVNIDLVHLSLALLGDNLPLFLPILATSRPLVLIFTLRVPLQLFIVTSSLPSSLILVVGIGFHHGRFTRVLLERVVCDVRHCTYETLVVYDFAVLLSLTSQQREHILVVQLLKPE
jgi:hypothetical protein